MTILQRQRSLQSLTVDATSTSVAYLQCTKALESSAVSSVSQSWGHFIRSNKDIIFNMASAVVTSTIAPRIVQLTTKNANSSQTYDVA